MIISLRHILRALTHAGGVVIVVADKVPPPIPAAESLAALAQKFCATLQNFASCDCPTPPLPPGADLGITCGLLLDLSRASARIRQHVIWDYG